MRICENERVKNKINKKTKMKILNYHKIITKNFLLSFKSQQEPLIKKFKMSSSCTHARTIQLMSVKFPKKCIKKIYIFHCQVLKFYVTTITVYKIAIGHTSLTREETINSFISNHSNLAKNVI